MTKRSIITTVLAIVLIGGMSISSIQAQDGPKLVGAFFVKGKVGLKWTAVNDASKYAIFRQKDGAEFIKIGTTDKTNYFDTNIEAGAKYVYKIAALVGEVEVFGITKNVKIPAEIDAFAAPQDLVSRLDDRGKGIHLRWKKQKSAVAFNIYRSTTSGGEYEMVGNATDFKYVDRENMVAGETYYYVVTAMNDEFEESGYSNEISVKFGLSKEEIAAAKKAESNIKLDSINIELAFTVSKDSKFKEADFERPTSFAFNSKGDIYIVSDIGRRVYCTDSNGNPKFSFGSFSEEEPDKVPNGAFKFPFTVAIDNNDRVYVSDIEANNIQIFTPEGKFIRKISVVTSKDEKPFRTNGMCILKDGRILCTDTGNHRVLILNPDGEILSSFINAGEYNCQYPNGIALINDTTFVFTNPIAGKIVVSTLNGKMLQSFGGQGMTVGVFGRALGVSVSEDGLIWITDGMGATIQAFTQKGEVKIAIGPAKNDALNKPRGIIVKDGRIYVANRGSGKLLALDYEITKNAVGPE
jgi:sugar lactone lactonase YvrE